MAFETHPPETDLIGTDPTGQQWEPHTVHTHYFGFQVPEAGIGGFTYIRYQPYFPLSQGNVIIFQGTDNAAHLDVAYLDWQMAMPYPRTEGNVITGVPLGSPTRAATARLRSISCKRRSRP
jgi:hypothetical protein